MRRLIAPMLALIIILAMVIPATAQGPEVETDVFVVFTSYDLGASEVGDQAQLQRAQAPESADALKGANTATLQAVGASEDNKIYDYSHAFTGFAARLSDEQAAELTKQPGVVLVVRDQWRYPTTDSSPEFLGLTGRGGAWAQGLTGEDVVIGVIDSGIWPEHPSFADDGSYGPPPVTLEPLMDDEGNVIQDPCYFGNTAHNPDDAPFTCNNKLLGARQMLFTYRALIGAEPGEFDSARDDDGHGTHTASTAGGNADVRAEIFGIRRGRISGIAPRARIIAYKGLGELGGFSSDLAAAIDQAVADGVDVINYSVGGGASLTGADDIAFLFAADAGVFVATSAGNSGPGAGTIGGPASVPWLTSVGANSHNRAFISDIRLRGPGRPPRGLWGGSVSVIRTSRNLNLVDAEGIADSTGDTSGMCLNAFPAGTFQANDAVLCNQYDFGVARTQRVAYVKDAGGGAVIFHNSPAVSMTPTDNHPLPTVHMLNDVGQPLKDYLVAHAGRVTVRLYKSRTRTANRDRRVVPNIMASFSSQGPDPVAEDIIKPDVTAPGLSILAGASPIHAGTAAQDELFQAIMGTSMSSPHVAGAFALLKQAHPDWSPAMAKSALMTTAYQEVMKHDYATPADPFDMGAGHIQLGPQWRGDNDDDDDDDNNNNGRGLQHTAFEPGLVYEAGFLDYLGFLCDEGPEVFADPAGTCASLESIGVPTEAHNLNYPSIGVAELAGSQTVVRTVTAVFEGRSGDDDDDDDDDGNGGITFKANVDAPPGYEVSVSPNELKLKSGDIASYEVTITNVNAPIGEWAFGSLTWKGGRYEVYSPIAVRASLFGAPAEVDGSGASGATSFDITFGYTGSYAAAPHGLVADAPTSGEIGQDPDQTYPSGDDSPVGVQKIDYPISGAAFVRWELVIPGDDDIDLFLEDSSGNIIAASTNGGTDELIELTLPADDTYTMVVHGWSVPNAPLPYTLHYWEVPLASGGSLSVDSAPTSAVLGTTGTVDVSWSGLAAGTRYLGAVSHTGDVGLMGLTLVNVDSP